jgi:membrane protein YdbS with pleckstrin-like domain
MKMTSPEPMHASFNPLLRPYMVLYVGLSMAATVVGIPVALVWFCGVGQWWARHYFAKLACDMDARALRFRKGIIFQVEKTIPLENIQDITFIEGPLLKRFQLSILKFETAGQSAGQAHAMQLVGVIDAHHLRSEILSRRDALKNSRAAPAAATSAAGDEQLVLLRSILARLDFVVEHLRKRP